MKRILFLLSIFLSASCINAFSIQAGEEKLSKEERQIFQVMRSELDRSMDELKKKGSIPPYFISYTIIDNDVYNISASYGAHYGTTPLNLKKLIVEVRVGSYEYDNSDINTPMGRFVSSLTSLDGDLESLKRDLWYQTNAAYEYAVKFYYFKKQKSSDEFKKKVPVASFSKEKSYKYYDDLKFYDFKVADIEKFMKNATAAFRKYPDIQFDISRGNLGNAKAYFITSEGSEIMYRESLVNMTVEATTQSDDGSELNNGESIFYNMRFEKLDLNKLSKAVEKIATELVALKKSPPISPETGPAILSPQATGVLFHEAVGHRLEGERQENEDEGQTFKESLGKKIIPEFLSVYDDPTASQYNGVILNGYYMYDDQGIPAQKVELIKDGILKNFLMSRAPVEKFSQSNGHGRASDDLVPVARMSNTFVRSAKEVPAAELKKMLLKECRRQNKSHGFIIRTMMGGETETAVGRFQVFKSVPLMVYRVDAKTGKEELVRGVEIVGTPLSSVNKIVATGSDYEVKNGYCGAESGWVRVSTVAPSTLISEIELQNKKINKKQLPIISRPK